jgi:hydroxyacylglutathione hydrolase
MIIMMNTGGIASTNCYLVADEESQQAVLFDAPNDTVAPMLDEAEKRGWKIIGVWFTHGHFDHIADHKVVTDRFPQAKVMIHKLDEPKLIDPKSQMFILPFSIPPRKADGYFEDEQRLWIGSTKVEVFHTPGHSPGHVVFYFAKQKTLIGGDMIIGGSVGRTDLPDSNHAQMEASLRRMMKLPPDTKLYAGHGDITTLGDERRTNEYLRMALADAEP